MPRRIRRELRTPCLLERSSSRRLGSKPSCTASPDVNVGECPAQHDVWRHEAAASKLSRPQEPLALCFCRDTTTSPSAQSLCGGAALRINTPAYFSLGESVWAVEVLLMQVPLRSIESIVLVPIYQDRGPLRLGRAEICVLASAALSGWSAFARRRVARVSKVLSTRATKVSRDSGALGALVDLLTFSSIFMVFWVFVFPGSAWIGSSVEHDEWLRAFYDRYFSQLAPSSLLLKYNRFGSLLEYLHAVPGALWCLLAPLQLSKEGRATLGKRHEAAGQLMLSAAAVLMVGHLVFFCVSFCVFLCVAK